MIKNDNFPVLNGLFIWEFKIAVQNDGTYLPRITRETCIDKKYAQYKVAVTNLSYSISVKYHINVSLKDVIISFFHTSSDPKKCRMSIFLVNIEFVDIF